MVESFSLQPTDMIKVSKHRLQPFLFLTQLVKLVQSFQGYSSVYPSTPSAKLHRAQIIQTQHGWLMQNIFLSFLRPNQTIPRRQNIKLFPVFPWWLLGRSGGVTQWEMETNDWIVRQGDRDVRLAQCHRSYWYGFLTKSGFKSWKVYFSVEYFLRVIFFVILQLLETNDRIVRQGAVSQIEVGPQIALSGLNLPSPPLPTWDITHDLWLVENLTHFQSARN